jgi:hypothetical protein
VQQIGLVCTDQLIAAGRRLASPRRVGYRACPPGGLATAVDRWGLAWSCRAGWPLPAAVFAVGGRSVAGYREEGRPGVPGWA